MSSDARVRVRYIRCKKNLIEGHMKSILIALACFVCATVASAEAVGTKYNVAHTRSRNADMVIIKVGPRFFEADLNTQARWYTDMQACVPVSYTHLDVYKRQVFDARADLAF